jgi:hypothetical protein
MRIRCFFSEEWSDLFACVVHVARALSPDSAMCNPASFTRTRNPAYPASSPNCNPKVQPTGIIMTFTIWVSTQADRRARNGSNGDYIAHDLIYITTLMMRSLSEILPPCLARDLFSSTTTIRNLILSLSQRIQVGYTLNHFIFQILLSLSELQAQTWHPSRPKTVAMLLYDQNI